MSADQPRSPSCVSEPSGARSSALRRTTALVLGCLCLAACGQAGSAGSRADVPLPTVSTPDHAEGHLANAVTGVFRVGADSSGDTCFFLEGPRNSYEGLIWPYGSRARHTSKGYAIEDAAGHTLARENEDVIFSGPWGPGTFHCAGHTGGTTIVDDR